MNELLEAVEIISNYLLHKPDFGGTTEARRLTELRYLLTGKPRSRDMAPTTTERVELVTRTLVLPVELDIQLTTIMSKTGISRDKLIAEALADLIAEKRLG